MKSQKVVAETSPSRFEKKVDELVSQGWKIIPETLKSTSAISSHWAEWFGGRSEVNEAYSFTVMLEKEN